MEAKETPTEGKGPVLDSKKWYLYANENHQGQVEIIDHLLWPSGTQPQVSQTPGPPCGEPMLPHCSWRIVKSKFDEI